MNQVAYLTGTSNYTWIHYQNGQKVLSYQTLNRVITEQYPSFIRIHKQSAINPAFALAWHLRSPHHQSTVDLNLKPIVSLRVGKRRVQAIRDIIPMQNCNCKCCKARAEQKPAQVASVAKSKPVTVAKAEPAKPRIANDHVHPGTGTIPRF